MEKRMLSKVLIVAVALTALAACQRPYDPYTGGANPGYSNSSYGYGSSTAPQGYGEGCAGGQQATLLHQNRPGGSDYSTWRCHTKGY
jgi:hypothetical protein